MVRRAFCYFISILTALYPALPVYAQQAGSIRGVLYDTDFDAPLPSAQIMIVETGEKVQSSDEGNYVFAQVPQGTYTLVFSKDGFTRQVKANVVVSPGALTELDMWLSGDFTDMEEFVVQDFQLGSGTEAALLELRLESPALMDSISADLMSKAGAGDAASALRLVAGASVQDGKYAVIRGLPDRYVNSQMNGVRLPTADADKRAVQLDQFPSAAIESIQVHKTFLPDQQGDASGGAVNVVLKGVPHETVFNFSSQLSANSQVTGKQSFLKYNGSGVNFLGDDDRPIPTDGLFDETIGVSYGDAPIDYKWSLSGGGKRELDAGFTLGGFASFFYERDSSFFKNGRDDQYWILHPGRPMSPQYIQGTPQQGNFKTQLFDVTQGGEEVKWGTLGTVGIETDNHKVNVTTLYTRVAEDEATLAEDTRGKAYYFPGYDPNDPLHLGNKDRDAAPYLRTETLQYTERTTQTIQFNGQHTLPLPHWKFRNFLTFMSPEVDWGLSHSSANLSQPDKRQFGSMWWAERYNPGYPPYVPPFTEPAVFAPYKPAENFTLGNLQRIWKDISEQSDQVFLDMTFPFEQWSEEEGYFKIGFFHDQVEREYNQDSYSNFNDNTARYEAPWEDFWSGVFPSEHHPLTAAEIDVDYHGDQEITAWYYMADIPLNSMLSFIGGARHEETTIGIVNTPESEVTWIPPGAPGSVELRPGVADVSYAQSDILPSLGLVFTPKDTIKIHTSFSETVARQTFKELTPIQQQEFLGGDVFIGNPFLRMSDLKNYDVRFDYAPYEGGLLSLSYFYKDIKDPIEYVQRIADFGYTTPVNYPKGTLSGYEAEVRQKLETIWSGFSGLSLGANATFINSEVTLPDDESAQFEQPNIQAPMASRAMTNAPEHLYNFFFTYDLTSLGVPGSQIGIFYTIRGDTLVAGAGQSAGKFVPNVYETQYGTLNLSTTHQLSENWKLNFQAKNLLDPAIQSVYRSEYMDGDVTKTSYRKGMEFSLSVSATF
jgi:hypothetical protein